MTGGPAIREIAGPLTSNDTPGGPVALHPLKNMDAREYLEHLKGGLPGRAVKLALLLLLALLTWAGIKNAVPPWVLAGLPITWAACPPRVYRIPRDISRLLRLTASLGFIYLLTSLVLWAIYEWDTNNWRLRWGAVILAAALMAASRFKRRAVESNASI